MNEYEISLWEDYKATKVSHDEDTGTDSTFVYLDERKLCIIGSDTMTSDARAIEPKLVENINGTHTFSFKMYQKYTDMQTGETYDNPFLNLLINERKVKVKWNGNWYDFIIKDIKENTSDMSITYTCIDLYINELSKNGYDIIFDTELGNNIGTTAQLAQQVLEGTTWQYDSENSSIIYQLTESPLYEVTASTTRDITLPSTYCYKIVNGTESSTDLTLSSNNPFYVYYAPIAATIDSSSSSGQMDLQFIYEKETDPSEFPYDVKDDDILIVGAQNYILKNIDYTYSSGNLYITGGSSDFFSINLSASVCDYRAERPVDSEKTEYIEEFQGYATVGSYANSPSTYYEMVETKCESPVIVTNLIANPSNFVNTVGWEIGFSTDPTNAEPTVDIEPPFDKNTNLLTYKSESYLCLSSDTTYINSGIKSNISYLSPSDLEKKNGDLGGFYKGEEYMVECEYSTGASFTTTTIRFVVKCDTTAVPNGEIFTVNLTLTSEGISFSSSSFNYSINAQQLADLNDNTHIEIRTGAKNIKIKSLSFYKVVYGTEMDENKNTTTSPIKPGQYLATPIKTFYKYYKRDGSNLICEEIVEGARSTNFTPLSNNYEKYGTVSIKESNRFNILQEIAETFKCWVRFRIDHDDTGKIKLFDDENNFKPQKYVQFLKEIGRDTGLSFEYGLDLKSIQRQVDSNALATKVIVLENSNQFAKNGFCTITRSKQNYSGANFILDFDYYIKQGLLDRRQVEADLYGTSELNSDIGYFYYLRGYYKKYDYYTKQLSEYQMSLLRLEAQIDTNEKYLSSAKAKKADIQTQICSIAGVDSIAEATYYAQTHVGVDRLKSLLKTYGQLSSEIFYYDNLKTTFNNNRKSLERTIDDLEKKISNVQVLIKNKHKEFNDRYAPYIFEGTWQDESYTDDDEYYLDALNVAYNSSRPQISYTINVIRLSYLEDFSSKQFFVGDVCFIEDKEYFGYKKDGITPYKEEVLISEITSYFDSPEKDVIKVQNYKTRFDDLFQRIAATTQSLQYSEGSYARAAQLVKPDRTLSFAMLQDTFDYNANLVLNASNQDVVWDETGITVTNKGNSADQTKIIAGGIFVTNDGGETWKNAVRGDGMSADLLTAGRINVSEVYVYNDKEPTFRWDGDGLSAYSRGNYQTISTTEYPAFSTSSSYDIGDIVSYSSTSSSADSILYRFIAEHAAGSWSSSEVERAIPSTNVEAVNFNKFVRMDQFGIYGYDGSDDFDSDSANFVPTDVDDILEDSNTKFALTWDGLMMKNSDSFSYVFITTSSYLANNMNESYGGSYNHSPRIIEAGQYNSETENFEPNFMINAKGDAYFKGNIEAYGKIYALAEETNEQSDEEDETIEQSEEEDETDSKSDIPRPTENTTTWMMMDNEGLGLFQENTTSPTEPLQKIRLGYTAGDYLNPYIQLGAGGDGIWTTENYNGYGIIKKGNQGIYIGESTVGFWMNPTSRPDADEVASGGIYIDVYSNNTRPEQDTAYVCCKSEIDQNDVQQYHWFPLIMNWGTEDPTTSTTLKLPKIEGALYFQYGTGGGGSGGNNNNEGTTPTSSTDATTPTSSTDSTSTTPIITSASVQYDNGKSKFYADINITNLVIGDTYYVDVFVFDEEGGAVPSVDSPHYQGEYNDFQPQTTSYSIVNMELSTESTNWNYDANTPYMAYISLYKKVNDNVVPITGIRVDVT